MRRDPAIRLLLVDDDSESAEELAELLESYGVVTALAGSAEHARILANTFAPDIALIDLELGKSPGAQLAAEWQTRGHPAIVLLSGRAPSAAETRLFKTEIPPLLSKPLDLSALIALVDRIRP